VVQELLGHSDISTTLNVYGHVLASMQQEACRSASLAALIASSVGEICLLSTCSITA